MGNETSDYTVKHSSKNYCKKYFFFMLILFFLSCNTKTPPDEELIKNFYNKKKILDRLVFLFEQEKNIRKIDLDFVSPSGTLEKKKLNFYHNLLKQANIQQINGFGDKSEINFIYYTSGLSISGTSKGYTYSKLPPDLIVNNLDEYYIYQRKKNTFLSYFAYRHITDKWYLRHIVDD